MKGNPYKCPNCHKAQRVWPSKEFMQGKSRVICHVYECGTKMYITFDPPKYSSELKVDKNCIHVVDEPIKV